MPRGAGARRLVYGESMPLRNDESLRYCRDTHAKYSAELQRPVPSLAPDRSVSPIFCAVLINDLLVYLLFESILVRAE